MKQNYCHQMEDTTPFSMFFGMIIHNLWHNIPSQARKGKVTANDSIFPSSTELKNMS